MEPAQRDEIIEGRLAAIRPVFDVMRISPAGLVTVGISSALVAQFERHGHATRNDARLAAHTDDIAGIVFPHRAEAGITGELFHQVG